MDSRMSLQIAQERIADWRRSAEAERRTVEVAEVVRPTPVIAIRRAGADESRELKRLAQMDSKRPLRGDALVAVVDGRLLAAISLEDRRVIADPMVPTEHVLALLRTRADQLQAAPRRARRRLRLRLA
jgi:hypothetical protein